MTPENPNPSAAPPAARPPPPPLPATVQTTLRTTSILPDPIVVKVKGKKKKRKHRSGLKTVGKLHRGMSKASRRIGRAVAKGLDEYLTKSDKSAEKRKDGALIDMRLNMARALGKTVSRSGRSFEDVAKSVSNKDTKRHLRSVARSLRPWAR